VETNSGTPELLPKSFLEAVMLRCRSGRPIRSACVLAFASLALDLTIPATLVARADEVIE